jgi:hypothetical protein
VTLTLYTVEVVLTTVQSFCLGIMGFFWGIFGLVAYIITTFTSTVAFSGAQFDSVVLFGL